MHQKRAQHRATSSRKIVAVDPATNGRRPAAAGRAHPPRGPLLAAAGQGHPRRLKLLAAPLRPSSRAPAAAAAPPRPGRPAAGSGWRARAEAPTRRRHPTCARHHRVPTPPRASASASAAHLAAPPGSAGEDRSGALAMEPPPRRRREVAGEPVRLRVRCRPPRPSPPQAPQRRPLPLWPRAEEAVEGRRPARRRCGARAPARRPHRIKGEAAPAAPLLGLPSWPRRCSLSPGDRGRGR
ncbi:hypothetical protein PVAP13_1KG412910 [Panicum virgatum]|uniref:Uncharacterized protein n=1 Tax=Panicum virgatum TaxID=38727 RepID=A0A8T0XQ24_PANVG|nr:hypothetical protein PVAP13_1KG412910 [Panicum virgatum]